MLPIVNHSSYSRIINIRLPVTIIKTIHGLVACQYTRISHILTNNVEIKCDINNFCIASGVPGNPAVSDDLPSFSNPVIIPSGSVQTFPITLMFPEDNVLDGDKNIFIRYIVTNNRSPVTQINFQALVIIQDIDDGKNL